MFGAKEAHRQEYELAGKLEVAALDLLEAAIDQLDLVGDERPDRTLVGDEAFGVDAVDALAAFLVRGRHAEHV